MLLSLFKGSANGFGATCSITRTDTDLTCCTIGVAIVIHTVLYVTLDTLDVFLVAAAFVHIFVHFFTLL